MLVSAAPPNRDQRWLNAGSRSSADGLSRRQLVLHSIAAPALMLAEAVDADAMTVVNSVLGEACLNYSVSAGRSAKSLLALRMCRRLRLASAETSCGVQAI